MNLGSSWICSKLHFRAEMVIRRPATTVEAARRLASVRVGETRAEQDAVPEGLQPQQTMPGVVSHATTYPAGFRPRAPARKEQVFVSANLPAPSVSPIFELLCAEYSPTKALQMIMRRAFDEYEAMLLDGSFTAKVPRYATLDEMTGEDKLVQTSRMMPVSLVAVARAHFDPLGFESARVFGHKLGTAALAAFFSK
jgi:hypothetical protein